MNSVEIRKYLVETALLTLLTGGIGMWIFHAVRPALFLSDYIWMPVYFYVIGALLMAGVARSCKGGNAKRLVQIYLLARMVKMFVSVMAVVIFCVAVRTEVTVVVAAFVIAKLMGPRTYNKVKGEPFECGIPTRGSSWIPVHVGYYLFAILFLVFDVETVFLYPWAVVVKDFGVMAMVSIGFFLLVLVFGLAYAWRKGALEWK